MPISAGQKLNAYFSLCMSAHVCIGNDPAQPHICIQALTVHLSVVATAPWRLLFSPWWGDEGKSGKSGRNAYADEPEVFSVVFFFWRIKGRQLGAKEKEGERRWCFQLAARTRIHKWLLGQNFLTEQIYPSSKENSTNNKCKNYQRIGLTGQNLYRISEAFNAIKILFMRGLTFMWLFPKDKSLKTHAGNWKQTLRDRELIRVFPSSALAVLAPEATTALSCLGARQPIAFACIRLLLSDKGHKSRVQMTVQHKEVPGCS